MSKKDKGEWSSTSYESTARVAATRGSSTYRGEERARQGKGLDPMVDPKTHGAKRESLNLMVKDGRLWKLQYGIAMPIDTELDTTGSMGENVNLAFAAIPANQKLLVSGPNAVLARYHAQFATSVIQDRLDSYPYQHSEYEVDNRVDEQMSMLVPEKQGDDDPEEYLFGLWYAAYRTNATIWQYGLKGYKFIVGDQVGRETLNADWIRRFFGVDIQQDMAAEHLGRAVLEKWHAFFLQVGRRSSTTEYWANVLGRDRVVILPETEDIAYVQAAIVGMTEGIFDAQGARGFLSSVGQLGSGKARDIASAVAYIPASEQTRSPYFDMIPRAGATFARREDVWPIDGTPSAADAPAEDGDGADTSGDINWQL